jgi:hypothetical protein
MELTTRLHSKWRPFSKADDLFEILGKWAKNGKLKKFGKNWRRKVSKKLKWQN